MGVPPGSYDSLDALPADTYASDASAPAADQAAVSQTLPPNITFATQNVPPVAQAGIYVTKDDQVQVTVWNSNANLTSLTVQIRIMRIDGTIILSQVLLNNLTADRTPNVATLTPGEGFLLAAVAGPPGVASSRGQTFVRAAIVRGAPPTLLTLLQLFADYITSGYLPGWPGGRVNSAVEGAGYVYPAMATDPAPGAEAQILAPVHTRWGLLGSKVRLSTSAQAGVRQVSFYLFQGGNLSYAVSAEVTQGPSSSVLYQMAPGVPSSTVASPAISLPGPIGFMLGSGDSISTATVNLQSGDQYQALVAQVEEWIDV